MSKKICPACKHKIGFGHRRYTKCPNNIVRNMPSTQQKDKLQSRIVVGGCIAVGTTLGFLVGGPPGAIWGGFLAIPAGQWAALTLEYGKSNKQ